MNGNTGDRVPLRLVYLEKSLEDVETVRALLCREGYEVHVDRVETEEDLASVLGCGKKDVVLSAFHLDGVNVFGALQKSLEVCPQVPFICVSRSINADEAVELLKRGATDCVLKATLGRLSLAIKRAIDETRGKEARRLAESELLERETFIKEVLDNLPIGIAVNSGDPAVKFEYMNDNFPRFYRTTREDLAKAGSFWSAVYEDEEFREALKKRIREDTASGDATRMHWHDVPISRQGQETTYVTAMNIPLPERGLMISTVWDVTERKVAEVAIRESEARYRSLVEHSPDAILVNHEGRMVLANQACLHLFGARSADQVLGKTPYELFHPDCHEAIRERTHHTRDLNEPVPALEEKIIRLDGEVVDVEVVAAPFPYGGTTAVHVILRDITRRKQVEEALAGEAIRRRILIEESKDGIAILNQDGSIYETNRRFAEMIGYSVDEVMGLSVWDWEARFTKEQVIEMLRDVDHRGQSIETRHRRKDGTVYDAEISTNGAVFAGHKLIFCVCRDITARKQAEAERERLLAAIEQAGESVMITDSDGIIQYINPTLEAVTGYDRKEALGRTPSFLKSGEQDEAFYRHLWKTITDGRIWEGRIVNRRKDGRLYTESGMISPVRDASGRIVNYVAVKRDITEQIRLTDQLQQAQRMESVGRLAGGVAHDFNNILSVIQGYTELALRKTDDSSPLRSDLQEVLKAANRSADITRQLLAFARKQTIAPRILDLNETVEGMLKMLRRLIGEDINLVWLPKARLWQVRMDPSQLDQILANLCVNSRDAITDVGRISIETDNVVFDEDYCSGHTGFLPGEYVLLALSDDGSGMDKETLKKIFEPFFTTKPMGEGTGLGLATVYGIVKQNEGYINVYSEPGRGTTSRIYLPRVRSAAGASEEERRPSCRAKGRRSWWLKTIR